MQERMELNLLKPLMALVLKVILVLSQLLVHFEQIVGIQVTLVLFVVYSCITLEQIKEVQL